MCHIYGILILNAIESEMFFYRSHRCRSLAHAGGVWARRCRWLWRGWEVFARHMPVGRPPSPHRGPTAAMRTIHFFIFCLCLSVYLSLCVFLFSRIAATSCSCNLSCTLHVLLILMRLKSPVEYQCLRAALLSAFNFPRSALPRRRLRARRHTRRSAASAQGVTPWAPVRRHRQR